MAQIKIDGLSQLTAKLQLSLSAQTGLVRHNSRRRSPARTKLAPLAHSVALGLMTVFRFRKRRSCVLTCGTNKTDGDNTPGNLPKRLTLSYPH